MAQRLQSEHSSPGWAPLYGCLCDLHAQDDDRGGAAAPTNRSDTPGNAPRSGLLQRISGIFSKLALRRP